jgi:hypothetical protein
MNFKFTDRDSYLAWRAEWKANYAELTRNIRSQKRGRKQFLRTYESTQTPQGRVRHLISKVANPEFGNGSEWQLRGLRQDAYAELEILKEAKALSWKLKQENAAAAAAAA